MSRGIYWEELHESDGYGDHLVALVCSNCGYPAAYEYGFGDPYEWGWHYCPRCGRRMKKR